MDNVGTQESSISKLFQQKLPHHPPGRLSLPSPRTGPATPDIPSYALCLISFNAGP
ncbi:hypothetical protein B0T17DRAFT_532675 [Bombardia bombarda]|uniref:Uncharacterized protein n=1 Tax=Bombardia bombarda TaxID=252184 RepID=A0AA39X159_9PEZI|nr:hypothetical protein B0T17DRAFT_532675 [Bombardia bombarda]